MKHLIPVAGLISALVIISTLPTSAAILGSTSITVLPVPPVSVTAGSLESDTTAFAFAEQQGVTVGSTSVNSYFLSFDPVTPGTAISGSITFDTAILGIADTQPLLNQSAAVTGLSSVSYNTSFAAGLETSNTFSFVGNTLTFTLKAGTNTDQIRVITAVPEPTSMAGLALLSLGGLALGRRKKQTV